MQLSLCIFLILCLEPAALPGTCLIRPVAFRSGLLGLHMFHVDGTFSQGTQYPLIKEYTVNHNIKAHIF